MIILLRTNIVRTSYDHRSCDVPVGDLTITGILTQRIRKQEAAAVIRTNYNTAKLRRLSTHANSILGEFCDTNELCKTSFLHFSYITSSRDVFCNITPEDFLNVSY